jgi:hypothetical protein
VAEVGDEKKGEEEEEAGREAVGRIWALGTRDSNELFTSGDDPGA